MGSMCPTVGMSRRSALRIALGAFGVAASSSLLAACQQAAPTAATPASTRAAPAAPAAGSVAKPSTLAELAMYTGPDRQSLLEEGAKQEGQLFWYTTNIVDQIARPLQQGFQAKYPFVKVE